MQGVAADQSEKFANFKALQFSRPEKPTQHHRESCLDMTRIDRFTLTGEEDIEVMKGGHIQKDNTA